MLRLQHLQKLAIWAGGETSIPPLSAFFSRRLATSAEAVGVPSDHSLFHCQRCETILQPGYNCTIRIEKNEFKARRHKKSCTPLQNSVVYTCHFCKHRNLKMGVSKGHMEELFSLRPRLALEPEPLDCMDKKLGNSLTNINAKEEFLNHKNARESFRSPKKNVAAGEIAVNGGPLTPSASERIGVIKSDKKTKMSGSGSSMAAICWLSSLTAESGKGNVCSSKRKLKGWSTLKETAEGTERESKLSISNLGIRFIM